MEGLLAVPREGRGGGGGAFLGVNMAPAVLERIGDEVGDVRDGLRSEDDVDVIDMGDEPLAVALRDATAHGHDALSRRRGGQALARGALAVEPLVGRLTHAARHEDDDVRTRGVGRSEAPI